MFILLEIQIRMQKADNQQDITTLFGLGTALVLPFSFQSLQGHRL